MEVTGVRRLWYTVDTVLKVPLLAWQHGRQPQGSRPGRWIAATVGVALLASPLLVAVDLLALRLRGEPAVTGVDVAVTVPHMTPVIGIAEPSAYLLVMGGLIALVIARSFRVAERRGDGLRYADSGAVLITVFVGAGPIVAWLLAIAWDLPAVALVGSVLPGLWLAAICAMALRRRSGPWPLAAVGVVAGLALMGVLGNLPLMHVMPGQEPLALLAGRVSMAVAVPAYLLWSGWAGVRLLLGRRDLLVAGPAPDAWRPKGA
jgi:hypothetical protein